MTAVDNSWKRSLVNWIHFRNPHSLGPVVVQSFMLLCAFLIILGLIYVFLLVTSIAIHHCLYDRDPKKVPDYVKNSLQFSSSESDMENEEEDSNNSSDAGDNRNATKYASAARKLANLDKFMNYDGPIKMRAVSAVSNSAEKDNG